MERLRTRLSRIEHQMRCRRNAPVWTVIHEEDVGAVAADALEREAQARGENVIRVVRTPMSSAARCGRFTLSDS